jgi:hypothetical protein
MTIHVLCFAYERHIPLRILIDSFVLQTYSNWNLKVIHDGPASDSVLSTLQLYSDPRIKYIIPPIQLGKWGNDHRKYFLDKLEADDNDFVLLTNDDNYYVPRFIELITKELEANTNVGIIYCDTVHNHLVYSGQVSEIEVGKIDGGCILVKADIAKKIGYVNVDLGHADGLYALDCAKYCKDNNYNIIHLSKFLFVHN